MRGVPKNIVAPCLFRAVGEVVAAGGGGRRRAGLGGGRRGRRAGLGSSWPLLGGGGRTAALPASGWGRGRDSKARPGPSLDKATVVPLSLAGPRAEEKCRLHQKAGSNLILLGFNSRRVGGCAGGLIGCRRPGPALVHDNRL